MPRRSRIPKGGRVRSKRFWQRSWRPTRILPQRYSRLVDELQKGGSRTAFDQRGQTVHGPQTNIAGNVSGPVLSGTFSGPVNTDKSK